MAKRILLVIVVLALAFGLYANPDPSDVVITITIPGAKVQEFRTGFLAMCPVPTIQDPNDPATIIPQFTEKQWIKEWIIRDLKRAYRHGKRKLAREAAQIDDEVIN